MQVGILMGQMGGKIASDTTVAGKFMGAQAVTEVTITAIDQPNFSPSDGRTGDTVPEQAFIYGDIESISFTGKLALFYSGR